MNIRNIDIKDYDYDLPADRIARYPAGKRDESKLLLFKDGMISEDVFNKIGDHIPAGSTLIFNNSRVIKARLFFTKETGAQIEILCLEPLEPAEYDASFQSKNPVVWKCIVGNLKKWKKGLIKTSFIYGDYKYTLQAEKPDNQDGETREIMFSWDAPGLTFGEVIEAAGHIPLPPYLNRLDESGDNIRYQTVYSSVNGSVAAPTAGLHFTDHVLNNLREKGLKSAEVTLHVGAGTFQPVNADDISEHEMHCEHFFVTAETIETIIANPGKVIAVGTTSVRTIESLFWLGVKILNNKTELNKGLFLDQWEPYEMKTIVTVREAFMALLNLINENNLLFLHASTKIMITPGYEFHVVNGIITNFHQPRSTLLMLISAWTGEKWREIYKYAYDNGFRFLSYGDSSFLLH